MNVIAVEGTVWRVSGSEFGTTFAAELVANLYDALEQLSASSASIYLSGRSWLIHGQEKYLLLQ